MWVDDLREFRKGKRIGGEILFFSEIDSTNREAHDQARKGAGDGTVVLADCQSRGKGRLERSWESPAGFNLYASIILRPSISLETAPQMTLLAGVAAANGLARASGLDTRIKWPNDIFLHGKKVAGILSEMEPEGSRVRFVILGIGVNINWQQKDIPPDLWPIATSLRVEGKKEISRALIAAEIFEEMEQEYTLFLKEGFSARLRDEWNRLSWVNHKWVTITLPDKQIYGQALGLDRDGALLLLDEEGRTQRFVVGDVSLRV
jgi:BirA family biotin operon repressor/biotin-[acetyl-CoA-carboxylase] ligase